MEGQRREALKAIKDAVRDYMPEPSPAHASVRERSQAEQSQATRQVRERLSPA